MTDLEERKEIINDFLMVYIDEWDQELEDYYMEEIQGVSGG